jgi:hypothetical protein
MTDDVYYHGTSKRNLGSFKNKGLKRETFLTKDPEVAKEFGLKKKWLYPSHQVVLLEFRGLSADKLDSFIPLMGAQRVYYTAEPITIKPSKVTRVEERRRLDQ